MGVSWELGGLGEKTYVDDCWESSEGVLVIDLVAGELGGDVLEKLREVCYFEKLVCSDELESLDGGSLQAGRERAVGKNASS